MSIYVTQIEKHKFVCGLFWQSLSRPRELVKEAGELAKKIDFDLMVLRTDHTTAQVGFANQKDGARRDMYSLAAAVSKTIAMQGAYYDGQQQRVHNWLGAFKLPDGMWVYFAVRDDNFLPNGDFAGTKQEVLERLHGDYGLGGWNAVIGDPELEDHGFHNFNAKRIEDLFPKSRGGQIGYRKWWGLRPVRPTLAWRPLAAGAAVMVLVVGGFGYWFKLEEEKEELARARAIEVERQRILGNAAPSDLPHPWAAKPLPVVFATACLERFTHLTAGGWRLEDYTCTADSAVYTWSRQHSTVAFLKEQLPDAIVELNGEKASYTVSLNAGKARDEPLLEKRQLLEPILSRLQLMKLLPKLAEQTAQAGMPQKQAVPGISSPMPLPDWKTFSFTLGAGGVPVKEIATILDRPGVRIDKLMYRGEAWSIEGVMYAK